VLAKTFSQADASAASHNVILLKFLRRLGDAIFPAQAFQHDPDLLLRAILLARGTANIFYNRLRGRL
jgi:hypothetical protein